MAQEHHAIDPNEFRTPEGNQVHTDLLCPNDGGLIVIVDASLRCRTCSADYGRPDDSDFINGETPYWGEVSSVEMQRIIDEARKHDFRHGLMMAAELDPNLFYYLFSAARADWVLPALYSSERQTCIDVGSGWGTISFLLARYFQTVYSVDIVPQRLEFQRVRKGQENANNIRLMRASFLQLPFADHSADVVVANGVLEWVGNRDGSRNPRNTQLAFLGSVLRILKPGGCLCVGIENRIGFQYFLGVKDHSGLRYTSLMPRAVASALVRLSREHKYSPDSRTGPASAGYRQFTYSLNGYRKLFHAAGFGSTEFYWVYPSYNYPRTFARLDHDAPLKFLLSQAAQREGGSYARIKNLVLRTALRLPSEASLVLWRSFCPHFLIYAHPKGNAPTNFDNGFVTNTGDQVLSSGSDKWDSALSLVDLSAGAPVSRMRIRRRDLAEDFERNRSGIVEPWIRGRLANVRRHDDRRRIRMWLRDFRRGTTGSVSAATVIERDMDSLTRYVGRYHHDSRALGRLLTDASELLDGESWNRVPIVAEHGDFWQENILIPDSPREDDVIVLDWENQREAGFAVFDPIFLVLTAAIHDWKMAKPLHANFAGNSDTARTLRAFLSELCADAMTPRELLPQAVSYAILRVVQRADPRVGTWNANYTLFSDVANEWSDSSRELRRQLMEETQVGSANTKS